jgi:hypothetical protein
MLPKLSGSAGSFPLRLNARFLVQGFLYYYSDILYIYESY